MSGNSSVGQAAVYEAGDQRNVKQSEVKGPERFNEGVENSHKPTDSSMKSQRRSSTLPPLTHNRG